MVGAILFLWRGTIPYTANYMYLILLIMASNLHSCGIVPLYVGTFPGSAGSIPLLSEIPLKLEEFPFSGGLSAICVEKLTLSLRWLPSRRTVYYCVETFSGSAGNFPLLLEIYPKMWESSRFWSISSTCIDKLSLSLHWLPACGLVSFLSCWNDSR